MIYSVELVADAILQLAEQDDESVTPMKLQKLVYYAQGWALGIRGEPLVDEQVEAWQYGPVFDRLYHKLKRYGSDPIPFGHRLSAQSLFGEDDPLSHLADDDRKLVEKVWRVYKKYTALDLSQMTHARGTPWHETWNEKGPKLKGTDIPVKRIREYFEAKAKGGT